MLQMADEVMVIIWKRLSDSGRNWRHVYKSLILVQYLIINGSERVSRLFERCYNLKRMRYEQFFFGKLIGFEDRIVQM